MANTYSDKKNRQFWNSSKEDVVNFIRDEVFLKKTQQKIEHRVKLFIKNNLKDAGKVQLDSDDLYYWFAPEIENNLFKAILKPENKKNSGDKLYRYVSQSSFKHLVEEGTITMASLICMNDVTEKNYANDYVKSRKIKSGCISGEKDSLNCYISSMSLSCDNLMMWNMYGGNAKGVELVFDAGTVDKGFTISDVDYANAKKEILELNYIIRLLRRSCYGKYLQLRRWNIWQHFFKPYYYKDEREVRLLYNLSSNNFDKREWHTSASGLNFPLIKFRVFDEWKEDAASYKKLPCFPLKLEQIVLGPLFPESAVNALALRDRLSDRTGSDSLRISCSQIKGYRES